MKGTKPRILVVDDEIAIRELVARKLTSWGDECATAADVTMAQEMIARSDFDLILLDILLPDGSGLELLNQLRERHPDVAVVMMTGVLDSNTAVTAMQLGAFDYLVKPFDLNELVTCVDPALDCPPWTGPGQEATDGW